MLVIMSVHFFLSNQVIFFKYSSTLPLAVALIEKIERTFIAAFHLCEEVIISVVERKNDEFLAIQLDKENVCEFLNIIFPVHFH